MKRGLAALAALLAVASPADTQSPLQVEHAPPGCFLADKSPLVLACLAPRSSRADVRVLFRADDGPWYASPLRFEMPCYRGALPRPSGGTPAVTYVIEATAAGVTARSIEHRVVVEPACSAPAPLARERAVWNAPGGAPRTPPGFEGTRVRSAGETRTVEVAPTRPQRPAAPTPAPPGPVARATPAAAAPAPVERTTGGGHGVRNVAIVLAGAAAAGGATVALRSDDAGSVPPTTTGSGLPGGGVAGTYVGTETIVYSGSCTGTDDIVLNLQQSATALSGVLSFTVRTCSCCSAGRGANPVSGFLSDTRVDLGTPIGFAYSGSFAGNRLSGTLSGPGGVTGTWSVDKR